jgi:putative DNA primase/helicase
MTWENLLDKAGKGAIRTTLRNAAIALREHQDIKGSIAFDELAGAVFVRTALPWDRRQNRPWTEHDDLAATEWLQEHGIHVGSNVTHEAVTRVAYEHRFHPVVEWLERLHWDGNQRLTKWFATYLGVPRSPLADAFGRAFLISAVARVMRPGCKVDHMPILEGGQGVFKSTALRTLVGDDWFADQLADLGTKDSSQDLRGKWIIELSELSAIRPHEVEKVKSYVTRQIDHYRPSYGRRSIDVPRQTVFVGTTNSREYLSDGTGGRRFWPTECTAIDIAAIARDRDQLWAEAVDAYHRGEPWWLTDHALAQAAEQEQELRRIEDPWEAVIADWLADPRCQPGQDSYRAKFDLEDGRVTNAQILEHAIGKPVERQGTSDQIRVGRILVRLGWEKRKSHGTIVWKQTGDTSTAGDTSTEPNSEVSPPSVPPSGPQTPRPSDHAGTLGTLDSRIHIGRVAEVVEISEGGVGSEGFAKEEPTPWTKLRQPRRRRH